MSLNRMFCSISMWTLSNMYNVLERRDRDKCFRRLNNIALLTWTKLDTAKMYEKKRREISMLIQVLPQSFRGMAMLYLTSPETFERSRSFKLTDENMVETDKVHIFAKISNGEY